MGRVQGFLLKNRVYKISRRIFRRRRSTTTYLGLNPPETMLVKPVSRLISWAKRLKTKAKAMVLKNHGFIRVAQDPVLEKPVFVPKGYMAVYVGKKEGDFERILVPVMYFNHPLFGDLLKESEKEYGYNHSGGIIIPCRISEFERVQTRIKAIRCTRKLLTWKGSNKSLTWYGKICNGDCGMQCNYANVWS